MSKKKLLILLLICLYALCCSTSAINDQDNAHATLSTQSVVLKWLGNAGWEIQVGKKSF